MERQKLRKTEFILETRAFFSFYFRSSSSSYINIFLQDTARYIKSHTYMCTLYLEIN